MSFGAGGPSRSTCERVGVLAGARASAFTTSRALTGLSAALLGYAVGLYLPGQVQTSASAVLAGLMALIAANDLAELRVPNWLSYSAAGAGLLAVGLAAGPAGLPLTSALGRAAVAGVTCSGALLAVREAYFRLRGIDGLGLGDVKLSLAGGIWLGWDGFAVAILIASTGMIAFVALRIATAGGWDRNFRLPFALALAPTIWLTWFVGTLLLPARSLWM